MDKQNSTTLNPTGGTKQMSVSNKEVLDKIGEYHSTAMKALAKAEENQIAIREISIQLNNGGIKDTLARIDERTKSMKETMESQNERLTHLEHRDWYVTIFSSLAAGIAAFLGIKV